MIRIYLFALGFTLSAMAGALSARAESAVAPAPVSAAEAAQPGANDAAGSSLAVRGADWDARMALAKRMHDIQPAAAQIDEAIATVSERLPVSERKGFEIAMKKILDYKALEEASITAMAETFTLDELKAMVAYNETPEAQSISRKFPTYQGKIQPKVFEMLDRAMMQVRTGSVPGTQK